MATYFLDTSDLLRLTKPDLRAVDYGHEQTLVGDDPWAIVEPLLPPERPKPEGGRPRVADRAALAGIAGTVSGTRSTAKSICR